MVYTQPTPRHTRHLVLEFICWKATKNWILTFNILAQFKFFKYQLDFPEHLKQAWLITLSFQKTIDISYAHISILISNFYNDVTK